jgi:ubiquinone/menaquinone biosynthesis C-methylase UbiE
VVDVGGGTGLYCFWLSSLGYETHLIEPAAGLVEQAKRRAQAGSVATGPKTCTVGDARQLWCDDGFADAVLMFGPLYHLLETSDRHMALAEALRILNPGGVLFAAGISRAASFADGMISGCLRDPAFCEIVEQDLKCGQHRNPTENIDYFTDAYFHRPGELEGELSACGFQILGSAPVEGLAMFAKNLDELWADNTAKERLLRLIEESEWLPEISGATAHMICVGRKAA